MARKKSLEQLSAEELYALAKAKEAEELKAQQEAQRAELEKLKAERKALVARHRKELAKIDARIRQLGGRTGGRRGRGVSVSAAVLDILADKKQHSIRQIQEELQGRGVSANNLAQTMAYLKRQGKVKSPKRSIYTLA